MLRNSLACVMALLIVVAPAVNLMLFICCLIKSRHLASRSVKLDAKLFVLWSNPNMTKRAPVVAETATESTILLRNASWLLKSLLLVLPDTSTATTISSFFEHTIEKQKQKWVITLNPYIVPKSSEFKITKKVSTVWSFKIWKQQILMLLSGMVTH